MKLYIDPGTGSMLFSLAIGLVSVVWFGARKLYMGLKYRTGGKVEASKNAVPLVIYSDDKRYWQVFEPVVQELDSRSFDVTYMTQSPDDPALSASYQHLHAEFIGEGNKGFAKLNFLNATIVLSTTPGLDVYQWKRSKDVKWYVHITHAPSELTTYKMFGVDFYDALLLSGQYQIDDCRALEKLRNEPEKECTIVGIPHLDDKAARLRETGVEKHERTVLVAPSWGSNSLLNRFGSKLFDLLISTGYHIIIRPHPQSFTSEKDMIEGLMAAYPDLEWNRDADNFDVLNRSDIMISDFSGVIFDFSLVFDKPVICAYTDFHKDQYDAWWLDTPIWTATAVPRIGPILSEENLPSIKELIDKAIDDQSYADSRRKVRDETWMYRGEGAKRTADYLIEKYNELTKESGMAVESERKAGVFGKKNGSTG
jgi:CDP-glycerol glycerophosphotransferase (TagB/SpsB family)